MTQKIALVVGASRGIGRQIAIGLASDDYHGEMNLPIDTLPKLTDGS